VQLQLDRSYGSRVVDAVMDNTADFGMTQLPADEKRLQVVAFYRDEIRLIVPAGHVLASYKSVKPEDVTHCVLLLPRQGKTRTRLNTWLEAVEDDLSVSMELDSTEMMKRFVLAGMGVTFLAVSNCREEIAAGKLHALPLAPEPMWRRLGLIYRKDKALSKAALAFIQIVMEHVGNEEDSVEKPLVPRVMA
jgi:DNA-binding transcriptional LysR family regulator